MKAIVQMIMQILSLANCPTTFRVNVEYKSLYMYNISYDQNLYFIFCNFDSTHALKVSKYLIS